MNDGYMRVLETTQAESGTKRVWLHAAPPTCFRRKDLPGQIGKAAVNSLAHSDVDKNSLGLRR